jgi:predicted MFS family arabinose efflux permease
MSTETPLFEPRGAYLRLWSAASISSLGSRISREGLPLTAVLVLGAGPSALGLLAAVRAIPAVAAGLLGGSWVDRTDRRRVMIGSDLVRAVLLLAIPLAAFTHRLTMLELLGAAALVGAAGVLFDMASHAYLPSIVAELRLVQANAALSASDAAAEVVGPGLTGVLVSALTAPLALAVNAATYFASGAILALIPREASRAQPAAGAERLDLSAGLRIALAEPRVRPLLLMAASQSLAGGVFSALYIIFAIRTLRLTPAMLGVTIAMGGAGALIGSALAARLARRVGLGPAIPLSAWAWAAFTALIPLAPGSPLAGMAVLMVAQLFGDAAGTASDILSTSARQSVLAPDTLGRTAGAFAAAEGLARALGALAGGVLAETIGMRGALAVSAAGLLAAPLWCLSRPLWRLGRA